MWLGLYRRRRGRDVLHNHSHAHSHEKGHHARAAEMGDRRLAVAVAINLGLTIVQVAGGILSGSLALIADALHNLSDAGSLVIAFAAQRIGRRPADPRMTFGYGRAEIVAALINFTTLILIGVYLGYEAVMRLLDPQPVEGWTVVIVAGVALAVDVATAALTRARSQESMNVRAAFLHNIADALASVAVIVGGVVVILYDWTLIDPILTLLISAYVLWHGASEIGGAIRILMLGTPAELDAHEVVAAMRAETGIENVHHVHLWRFDERRIFLEAHLVLSDGSAAAEVKARVRRLLSEEFGVRHVTLETERSDEACQEQGALQA